jgi:hypothetical protein
MLETTLRLLAENDLVVQASEVFPRLFVIVRREPVWQVGTAGISIWKGDWRSGRNMVLAALLAVLVDYFGVGGINDRRNQEVWAIATEALETGFSVVVDHFDEVSTLLFS